MSSLKSLYNSRSIEQIEMEARLAEEEERKRMEEELKAVETKAVTVRLSAVDIVGLDGLAHLLNTSRQDVLSDIIFYGLREAVTGYFQPYTDTDKEVNDFYRACSKAVRSGESYASTLYSVPAEIEGDSK